LTHAWASLRALRNLDQTAEFFRSELPDDLQMAGSSVAQRLDAPRNKISGLTGVPLLRHFFNHPTDVPLREIIEARDILIVDANMGAIGTENSRACMHVVTRARTASRRFSIRSRAGASRWPSRGSRHRRSQPGVSGREIDQSRAARFAHDLHAAGWAIAFHHAVGTLATDRWRTPRYATGRYPVPQVGSSQRVIPSH
jgi:hypothetical protein